MIDTDTTSRSGDDVLHAAAAEIHRAAPSPHPWDQIVAQPGGDLAAQPSRRSRGLLAVAATSILLLGLAGVVAVARDDSGTEPAASNAIRPVGVDARPWSPVIEQPVLTADIDAIPVSNDPADWADRALFPSETPQGFTIQSVSRGTGGALTETGGVDTGDVSVQYITTTPSGTVDDPRIMIESTPAGVGNVDSDVEPETIVTGAGAEWDIYVEQGPSGTFHTQAFTRTDGPGGMLSLNAMDSAEEALATTEAVLTSLRLVRIDEIPTDVVDLNRLPVVATVDPGDATRGFMSALRTTNAWCVVSRIGNSGAAGCRIPFVGTNAPAVFIDFGYSDEGVVALSGMAAPGVTKIEFDLTDGATISVVPTFTDDSADRVGFWVTTHRHEGMIASEGPVVATRVFGSNGAVLGAVQGP